MFDGKHAAMEKSHYAQRQQVGIDPQPDLRRPQLSPGVINELDATPAGSNEDLPIYELVPEISAGNLEQNVAATALGKCAVWMGIIFCVLTYRR